MNYLTPFCLIGFIIFGMIFLGPYYYEKHASADYYANYTRSTALGIPLSHSELIGIQLSQTCLVMEKYNITSHCLTYDKIKKFDNTNPLFAGKWESKPYYHRDKPRVMNHYNFNPNKFIIMADPNPDFTTRARMIIVWDSNFTWTDSNGTSSKGIIKVNINRYVDNCETATVAPNLWLINDTIHYLESDCNKTKYNDTKIIYVKQHPFSFNNPYSPLLDPYFHANRNGSGGNGLSNCINHKCVIKDPYANW